MKALFSQYNRLNLHVGDSNIEVIRRAWRMCLSKAGKSRALRGFRREFLRSLLKYHSEAQKLYKRVMK